MSTNESRVSGGLPTNESAPLWSEGLSGVFSLGLSNYSQRIFRRMGFVERNCLEYSQYTQVAGNLTF